MIEYQVIGEDRISGVSYVSGLFWSPDTQFMTPGNNFQVFPSEL